MLSKKDISKLLANAHVGRVGNKGANYKDMAKANKRRHEKHEKIEKHETSGNRVQCSYKNDDCKRVSSRIMSM